ncbi:unnamed protein product [Symbiodinium necroappetens]|uniref:Reverse transcriptase domain-containing protein n=1 Tax=Symbiodinium necroappetens TaxID=1628268 RepID=A0A812IZE7_9DINO|nr:unnamed protein product [Symbiodinium necroappetens]
MDPLHDDVLEEALADTGAAATDTAAVHAAPDDTAAADGLDNEDGAALVAAAVAKPEARDTDEDAHSEASVYSTWTAAMNAADRSPSPAIRAEAGPFGPPPAVPISHPLARDYIPGLSLVRPHALPAGFVGFVNRHRPAPLGSSSSARGPPTVPQMPGEPDDPHWQRAMAVNVLNTLQHTGPAFVHAPTLATVRSWSSLRIILEEATEMDEVCCQRVDPQDLGNPLHMGGHPGAGADADAGQEDDEEELPDADEEGEEEEDRSPDEDQDNAPDEHGPDGPDGPARPSTEGTTATPGSAASGSLEDSGDPLHRIHSVTATTAAENPFSTRPGDWVYEADDVHYEKAIDTDVAQEASLQSHGRAHHDEIPTLQTGIKDMWLQWRAFKKIRKNGLRGWFAAWKAQQCADKHDSRGAVVSATPTSIGCLKLVSRAATNSEKELSQAWAVKPIHVPASWSDVDLALYPQFAYQRGRSQYDALRKVFTHCAAARAELSKHHKNLHHQWEGHKSTPLFGSLMVTVDLSQAFDKMPRELLLQGMIDLQLPADLIAIIMAWHAHIHYTVHHSGESRTFAATQGIRQGCSASPILWLIFSHAISSRLEESLGYERLCSLLTIFTDDYLAAGVFTTLHELEQLLSCVAVLFKVLRTFGMAVSDTKSQAIIALRGTLAPSIRRRYTRKGPDGLMLRIPMQGDDLKIPLAQQFRYLGAQVSYASFEDATLAFRIQKSDAIYGRLGTALRGRHHLTSVQRIRLWLACVWSTMSYSLTTCGLTDAGHRLLETKVIRQLRAILRLPVHLTHTSNLEVLEQAGLTPPCVLLATLMDKEGRRKLPEQDAHLCRPDHAWWTKVRESLNIPTESMHIVPVPTPVRPQTCPECGVSYNTRTALLTHIAKHHHEIVDKEVFGDLAQNSILQFGENLFGGTQSSTPGSEPPSKAPKLEAQLGKRGRPSDSQSSRGQKDQDWLPNKGRGKGNKHSPQIHQLVYAVGRLIIRQETPLQILKQNSAWTLYLQPGQTGPVALLCQAAAKYKEEAKKRFMDVPVRALLLHTLFQALLKALQSISSDNNKQQILKDKGWLNTEGNWNYQQWDSEQQALKVSETKPPMNHQDLIGQVSQLAEPVLGKDVIHRFNATHTMTPTKTGVTTFLLEVIGLQIRREGLRRGGLANDVQLLNINYSGAASRPDGKPDWLQCRVLNVRIASMHGINKRGTAARGR